MLCLSQHRISVLYLPCSQLAMSRLLGMSWKDNVHKHHDCWVASILFEKDNEIFVVTVTHRWQQGILKVATDGKSGFFANDCCRKRSAEAKKVCVNTLLQLSQSPFMGDDVNVQALANPVVYNVL